MKKTGDSGNLSIDFLVGFTIFLLAFIWVVSMIPGLLINLQSFTIDSDAVAYRTGVILAEDPGEPTLPFYPWETLSKKDIVRFGLSVSKDTPNILSREKVDKFFCSSVFSYPDDYQERIIFGDYPFRFNISLTETGSAKPSLSVGDVMSGNYGTIRRLVKIKEPSYATINSTNYMNEDNSNATVHEFSILFNKSKLLEGKVSDPIYQIDPAREKITINITYLNSTLTPGRENCFDINLTKIYVKDPNVPIKLFPGPVIDEILYPDINTEEKYAKLPNVQKNISLTLDPTFIPWSNYPLVSINLTFNLVRNNTACPLGDPAYNFTGSRFLNNSFTSAFDYNYNQDSVKQPELRDAVLEVNTGSGYRTVTGPSAVPLVANFKYEIVSGTPLFKVKFTDISTGTPVDWEWDFTNDGTIDDTLNNPTHDYNAAGIYTVNLTVKDAAGGSAYIDTIEVRFIPPIASFNTAPTPATGTAPFVVTFTDNSTGGASDSWDWDFGDASPHSNIQNPSHTYTRSRFVYGYLDSVEHLWQQFCHKFGQRHSPGATYVRISSDQYSR
jgi:PKD repeat protein